MFVPVVDKHQKPLLGDQRDTRPTWPQKVAKETIRNL